MPVAKCHSVARVAWEGSNCGSAAVVLGRGRERDGVYGVSMCVSATTDGVEAGAGEGWDTVAEGELVGRHSSTWLPVHHIDSDQRLK